MNFRFAAPIAFAATIFGAPTATAAPEATIRISPPLVHENLAIYPVRGPSAAGPVPATLEEALNEGTIVVHETGNVRELKIENKGRQPVFIQFGDLVKGGRQDRVLTTSLLIPPGSGEIAIGAYCVEQGRWSQRGSEDVTKFSTSSAQIFSREAKVAIARAPTAEKSASNVNTAALIQLGEISQERTRQDATQRIHERGTAHPGSGGQSEVWRSVSAVQGQLGARVAAPVEADRSKTSLQLTLENEKLKAAQEAFVAALEAKALEGEDVVGVVIAVNGKLASADIYPSNGLFRKMWPKLVRAAALEAFVNRKDGETASAPSIDNARGFLASRSNEASTRTLAGIATHHTRLGQDVVQVEARSASGAWIHRNYLATK